MRNEELGMPSTRPGKIRNSEFGIRNFRSIAISDLQSACGRRGAPSPAGGSWPAPLQMRPDPPQQPPAGVSIWDQPPNRPAQFRVLDFHPHPQMGLEL